LKDVLRRAVLPSLVLENVRRRNDGQFRQQAGRGPRTAAIWAAPPFPTGALVSASRASGAFRNRPCKGACS
jgi:hypothetical protein